MPYFYSYSQPSLGQSAGVEPLAGGFAPLRGCLKRPVSSDFDD